MDEGMEYLPTFFVSYSTDLKNEFCSDEISFLKRNRVCICKVNIVFGFCDC